ncbi:ABC transporter permease [Candidatus Shapirobacteria bacterium]|nr:ABC transporter permease [Candidatus Shapirobacteria bacterium]
MKLAKLGFFKVALEQLRRNKLRSFLTMLGMIIGVSSVILLISIGSGLKAYINEQFEDLGSNIVYVMPVAEAQLRGQGGGFSPGATTTFDQADLADLERLKLADLVVPMANFSALAAYKSEEFLAQGLGCTVDIAESMNLKFEYGRFFTKSEESRGKSIVVLAGKVKEELFGESNPVGKKIKVEGEVFEVVGSVAKKGGGLGNDIDSHVYLPYKTVWRLLGKKEFHFFTVSAKSQEEIPELKNEIEKALLKNYEEDDFSVVDQADLLSTIGNILNILTAGLAGIAAISLVVGGVGIMNIMFVSVTERIKEIGLRKAVGATSSDILWQFLLESVVVAVVGGLIGVVFSWLLTLVINKFFPAQVTLWSVVLAFGVSSLIGVVFGVVPARRAAALSPIEALRYE